MARRRTLTPEQEAEVYRRFRLHYDNSPRVIAHEMGISLDIARSTFNRERWRLQLLAAKAPK